MLGNPKYKRNDKVSFKAGNNVISGIIEIVDAYGTFFQRKEPSYDILGEENGRQCLYKHIPESFIINDDI